MLDSTLSEEKLHPKFESAFPPSKILVPIDGSPMSKKAADVAARIAKDCGAEMIVLSVIPIPRFVGGLDVPRKTFDEYYDYMDQDARKSVNEVVTKSIELGVSARAELLRTNSTIVETITDMATGEKINLIVMGTRGLGGFKKLLLGSVSSGVVLHAACNVLVIK